MDAKSWGIITPKPFFKIKFECSDKEFREVRWAIIQLALDIGTEIEDNHFSEKYDSENDLYEIRIYNSERHKNLINEVLHFYGINEDVSEGLDIVLSIF